MERRYRARAFQMFGGSRLGDLETGPSTAIMKATPECVIPPHDHTAQ
jgi:hypothetical protein